MKRKFNFKGKAVCALATVVCLGSVGGVSACTAQQSYDTLIYSMGVYASLSVSQLGFSQSKYAKLSNDVEKFLNGVEKSVSTSVQGSCIYEFNGASAGKRVEIDRTAYEILSEAVAMYELTGGKFNPAIWHSSNAYHFAKDAGDGESFNYLKEDGGLPDEKYAAEFAELASHFGEIDLREEEGKYYATMPFYLGTVQGDTAKYNMRIDLGGIAKGWCADRVNEMMKAAGVKYGNFNFGFSSVAVRKDGSALNRKYELSAKDPRDTHSAFFSIKIKDTMLSTSGDYEKYYEVDGTRYCHIIDPATGKPIQTGVASVTLIGEGGAKTDALTSALSCMDKQTAVDFINEHLTGYKAVMLVFEDGVGKIITNCPKEIAILNKNYILANTVSHGKIILN